MVASLAQIVLTVLLLFPILIHLIIWFDGIMFVYYLVEAWSTKKTVQSITEIMFGMHAELMVIFLIHYSVICSTTLNRWIHKGDMILCSAWNCSAQADAITKSASNRIDSVVCSMCLMLKIHIHIHIHLCYFHLSLVRRLKIVANISH